MLRLLSVGVVAMVGFSSLKTAVWVPEPRAAARDSITEERAYALAVGTIGDSAIHALDFFPARAQLRIQTAFLNPSLDLSIPFDDLAARSLAASQAIGGALERMAVVSIPRDLKDLNAELVKALNSATRASVALTTAAHACQMSVTSVERCQVPFSSASSRMAESYKRYVGARAKIRAQILDTDTHLADFDRR
jgi:hypothetical protein